MKISPVCLSRSVTVSTIRLLLSRFSSVANFRSLFSTLLLWRLACVASVTAILYWRRPDAFYNPQLWAEDGSHFFSNAFFLGAKSLVLPFAGYFHTLARMIAWIGSWIAVRYVPYWYGFASWALLIFMIGYIFSARLSFGNELKFLLGLALVTTTANNEIFFNLANWATITSLFWLLLAISDEPQSRPQSLFDATLLILTGLNSPFAICLWPIFLLRWRVHRTANSFHLFGLSLLVALIQVWNMPARINAGGAFPIISPLHADVFIYRFGFMFLGEQVSQLQLTDPLRIFGLILIIGFYGCLLWYAVKTQNWPMLIVLAGGIFATSLSLYVMRNTLDDMIHSAGRHFFIPAVTLVWAFILSKLKPWYLRWAPLTMVFVAFLFLTPSNKNEVRPDLDWVGHTSLCIGTQRLCKIPINPGSDPWIWFAYMNSHVFIAPTMQTTVSSRYGHFIELMGYDFTQNHAELSLKLVWRALGTMKTDYKFFVHLLDPNDPGQILVQEDMMPLEWKYPTSKWVATEIVVDQANLSLATLRPGQYKIAIGWYDPNSPTMDRLTAYDSGGQNWKDDSTILPVTVVIP